VFAVWVAEHLFAASYSSAAAAGLLVVQLHFKESVLHMPRNVAQGAVTSP
jgi:hypothetical protein